MFFQLEENGYKFRVIPLGHLEDLKKEIARRREEGIFPEALDQNYIGKFVFSPPPDFPDVRSLVILAIPRPAYRAIFNWKGKKYSLQIPVTYSFYEETLFQMEGILNAFLSSTGHRVVLARLPLKLLAVRSGLAFYGRNNISYIPGLGSYYQLASFFSNLSPESGTFGESRMAPDCDGCYACQNNCPTGAISEERFRIKTELCLAFYSENNGELPPFFQYSGMNLLIGCSRCQEVCPMNFPFVNWVGGKVEFSNQETEILIKGDVLSSPFAEAIKDKFYQLGILEYLEILPRNLMASLGV